jgi:hypothetical protein
MSSTNRSNARSEHVADYYRTPVNDIVCFLNEFTQIYDLNNYNIIIDPCAGGLIDKDLMSYPEAFKQIGYTNKIHTVDIREDSLADKRADFLTLEFKKQPDMFISNPPFNQALSLLRSL